MVAEQQKALTAAEGLAALTRIPADEPVFILRAQDLTAPGAIISWIETAQARGVNKSKIDQALTSLGAFLRWPNDRKRLPD